jgi:membrane protease YdiL (CAAX protease family)
LVILLGFGWFIARSFTQVATGSAYYQFTSEGAATLIAYEVIVLVLLTLFLKERGLHLFAYRSEINIGTTLLGLFMVLAYYIIISLIGLIIPDTPYVECINCQLPVPLIVLVSIVNGFYEETLEVGYLIGRMVGYRRGTWGVIMSIAIRFMLHTYQGLYGLMSITVLGLLFSFFYLRSKKLWPLVTAHIILDAIPLFLL